jgi:hypothetical protein
MPGAKDKLELNLDEAEADFNSMRVALLSGLKIANDIETAGFLKDAQQFVPKQKSICKKLHSALGECIKAQRELDGEMSDWLDAKLGF